MNYYASHLFAPHYFASGMWADTSSTPISEPASPEEIILRELSIARGRPAVGNNNTVWILELRGATIIEPTAFEPDPATHREDYYYNAMTNVLYRKVITKNRFGVIHAFWQKASD